MDGVAMLTMEERGMYISLLCYQWTHGPLDPKRVGLFLGLPWDSISLEVRQKFKKDDNGRIYNQRLEDERAKRAAFKEKQRINGQKGGRPKNPNKTQTKPKRKPKKKPLGNGDGNGSVYDNENGSGNVTREVVFPFSSKTFADQWDVWKEYRSEEHGFKYRSPSTEQAALKKLSTLSQGNEETAIEIIHQSLANGWKGFFPIEPKRSTSKDRSPSEMAAEYIRSLGSNS
jgi:uncharacterized protein YdaU (DUF1376 family)